MARCKMDQPERAAYLRVFCAVLLTDEDFETLDRAKFGSACLLMFHAWAKRGSLPNDPRKLAALAKCSVEELEELQTVWPKLVPLETLDPEAEPGRVTIPYLWREWQQVMGFYDAQRDRAKRGADARWKQKDENKNPQGDAQGDAGGHEKEPKIDAQSMPNQDQAQDQAQDQDQTKRKEPAKRGRKDWQEAFTVDVLVAFKEIMGFWPQAKQGHSQPTKDGNYQDVPRTSGPDLASRLDAIKKQGGDLSVCIAIAKRFVGEWERREVWLKAAENFFGKSDDAPWKGYYKAEATNRAMASSQKELPLEVDE